MWQAACRASSRDNYKGVETPHIYVRGSSKLRNCTTCSVCRIHTYTEANGGKTCRHDSEDMCKHSEAASIFDL